MNASIAVDARMAERAGVGTYIRQLLPRVVSALADCRFTVVTRPDDDLERWPEGPPGWSDGVRRVAARSDIYTLRQHWELGSVTASARPDLWWIPHYDVPLRLGAPFVATVHDVAHLALGSMYGGPLRTTYARGMFRRVRRRARHIIFVSRFSESEFVRHLGAPVGPHSVIHNGVDDRWFAVDSHDPPHGKPYVLFVGSAKPHKNLSALLAAFARIAAEVPHDLVIVGATSGMRTTDPVAARLPAPIADRVTFTGAVDQPVLRRYMAHAAALVLPSLYEGFGLPPLEAMAAGCPCLVSSVASLPEVCGPAAVYCDPHDTDDIARQMRRLLDDQELRARLVVAGRERVRQFQWSTAATETAAVLAGALDHASAPG